MNNTAFPNREIILSAMGFTEPPVVTGTEQMLYFIISHSLWFGDIHNRYMPNYKSDLLLNTFLNDTIENPEDMLQMNPMYSYNRYLLCSLMEYGKLYRYMTHCCSRGLGLELYDGDFSVLIDDFTESQCCSEEANLPLSFGQGSKGTRTVATRVETPLGSLSEGHPIQLTQKGASPQHHQRWCPVGSYGPLHPDEFVNDLLHDDFVDEENIDFNSIHVPLNKQKVRCIRRTRMSILHFKKSIQDNVDLLRSLESFLHDISFNQQYNVGFTAPLECFLKQASLAAENLLTTKVEDRSCLVTYKPRSSVDVTDLRSVKSTDDDVIRATTDKFITQDSVQQYIDFLDEKRALIQQHIEKCRLIQQTRTELKKNLENIHKYKLKDDLNMRSVEFCMPDLMYFPAVSSSVDVTHLRSVKSTDDENVLTSNIDDWRCLPCVPRLISPYFKRNVNRRKNIVLPDELMRIIRSFIGEEVLQSARRKCTMDRYFPEGRDDVVKILKQWRNCDLIKFSEQVFLRYNVNYDRKRWRRVALRKSSNKTILIENLLSCNYRCTFFEFLRDVFFLTRIFDSKRGHRSGRGR